MSPMNRRRFVKIVSGALGAGLVHTIPRGARWANSAGGDDRTKIYTIFFATAPSKDDCAVS